MIYFINKYLTYIFMYGIFFSEGLEVSKSQIERRKFLRFEAELIAKVGIKTELEFNEQGLIKDFSREGLRLILTNLSFKPHSPINLNIYLPNKEESIPVLGEIKWTRLNSDNKGEIGIKIKEIDKAAKSEILDYLYNQWQKRLKDEG